MCVVFPGILGGDSKPVIQFNTFLLNYRLSAVVLVAANLNKVLLFVVVLFGFTSYSDNRGYYKFITVLKPFRVG